MAAAQKELEPHFKLWLSTPEAEGVFGDGKWRLLEAIEQAGSLRAACAALEMSYRKAWGDLRKAEQGLGVQLLTKHRGGSGGGETTLTDAGRRWLGAYGRFRAAIEKEVEMAYVRHMAPLVATDAKTEGERGC